MIEVHCIAATTALAHAYMREQRCDAVHASLNQQPDVVKALAVDWRR